MFATQVTARSTRTHTLAINGTVVSMYYDHRYANDILNFKDNSSGSHTNTIKGLWTIRIQRHINPMRGMNQKYLDQKVDEYMWSSWVYRQGDRHEST
ncbi:hypothetical protein PHMEG_00039969 [Phytophthora megakarya]|uniref:Uncharacterized protein n=1 Tax=Phytophthora megakarya TaxID=4795 RepID=A0A225UDY6_9STRA|nr:hypothetical protein PHMEG_00039969 [Phytophthora megakarya]